MHECATAPSVCAGSYTSCSRAPTLAEGEEREHTEDALDHNSPAAPAEADAAYEAEWASLVERFADEKSDPRWNPALELGRKLMASLPRGSSLRSLTCRASLCRLETSHRNLSNYQSFTELFELSA